MEFNGDSNHNGDHSMGIAWDIYNGKKYLVFRQTHILSDAMGMQNARKNPVI